MIAIRMFLMRLAALPRLPRTAAEAKEMVRRFNADAKRARERKEAEDAERARELAELDRRRDEQFRRLEAMGQRPRHRSDATTVRHDRGVKIDRAGIYASRRPQPDGEDHPPSPAVPPRRPRSFDEIARGIYGPPDAGGGSLITSTPRGAR